MGLFLKELYKNFYGFDDKKVEFGFIKFREYYVEKGFYENKMYSGIFEVLEKL